MSWFFGKGLPSIPRLGKRGVKDVLPSVPRAGFAFKWRAKRFFTFIFYAAALTSVGIHIADLYAPAFFDRLAKIPVGMRKMKLPAFLSWMQAEEVKPLPAPWKEGAADLPMPAEDFPSEALRVKPSEESQTLVRGWGRVTQRRERQKGRYEPHKTPESGMAATSSRDAMPVAPAETGSPKPAVVVNTDPPVRPMDPYKGWETDLSPTQRARLKEDRKKELEKRWKQWQKEARRRVLMMKLVVGLGVTFVSFILMVLFSGLAQTLWGLRPQKKETGR